MADSTTNLYREQPFVARFERFALEAEAMYALAHEISDDFPCREDFIGHVENAMLAARQAAETLKG